MTRYYGTIFVLNVPESIDRFVLVIVEQLRHGHESFGAEGQVADQRHEPALIDECEAKNSDQ